MLTNNRRKKVLLRAEILGGIVFIPFRLILKLKMRDNPFLSSSIFVFYQIKKEYEKIYFYVERRRDAFSYVGL